jgi:hypothetical protein
MPGIEELLDARPRSSDLGLRAAHALAQFAGSYTRLVETADLEERVTRLEAANQERNGHRVPRAPH